MPRNPTTDLHAELAVDLYNRLLDENGWGLDHSWLAISKLLMSCEIWQQGIWGHLHDVPVLVESNNYTLKLDGTPGKTIADAMRVKEQLARELGVDLDDLCGQIGQFWRHGDIRALQPNNPRGHAFRSIVAQTLSRFGDQDLNIEEEVSPHTLFPGYDFGNRSRNPRIDIVVRRGRENRVVALMTTRWTYRHDRVDIIDEARAYMPAARNVNQQCRFFGVTAEFMPARLNKVIQQTSPVINNAAINRLVHLNPDLPGVLLGNNGNLAQMWSLRDMVGDSANWN